LHEVYPYMASAINRGIACSLALALLLVGVGCGGARVKAAKKPEPTGAAETQPSLPGGITGQEWHILWSTRNPTQPNGKPLPVVDAHARTGELMDRAEGDTILLHDVHARLYRNGKPAAIIDAPQVTANQRDRILVGTGGVTLISLADPPDTTVKANKITWNTRTDEIVGVGNTHIVRRLRDGTPFEQIGGRVTYDSKAKDFNIE